MTLTFAKPDTRWLVVHDLPSKTFLVVLGLAGIIWLWSETVPGEPLAWYLLSMVALPVTGVFWLVLLVRSLISRKVQLAVVVALAVVLVLGSLSLTHSPSKARFALSSGGFDDLVDRAGEPATFVEKPPITDAELATMWSAFPTNCPANIGTFSIRRCTVFPAGYLFFETSGAMFTDAGFAYLPNGVPDRDIGDASFAAPNFVHLQGAWYSFTSTW